MQQDGQIDMTQLTVDLRNFVNAPKNSLANITAIFSLSFAPDCNKDAAVVMLPSQHDTTLVNKGKGKGIPRTGHEGPGGKQRHSSTISLTSALDGGWVPRPGCFTPEKDPVPIVQEAGWAPGPVWTGAENLAPHRDLIPGQSSPQPVGIPTTLTNPRFI